MGQNQATMQYPVVVFALKEAWKGSRAHLESGVRGFRYPPPPATTIFLYAEHRPEWTACGGTVFHSHFTSVEYCLTVSLRQLLKDRGRDCIATINTICCKPVDYEVNIFNISALGFSYGDAHVSRISNDGRSNFTHFLPHLNGRRQTCHHLTAAIVALKLLAVNSANNHEAVRRSGLWWERADGDTYGFQRGSHLTINVVCLRCKLFAVLAISLLSPISLMT